MNTDPKYAPDYQEYLKRDLWELEDAISLLLNINPNKTDARLRSNKKIFKEFDDLTKMVVLSKNRSLLWAKDIMPTNKLRGHFMVEPKIFINWAHSKEYEIPEPLLHLLDEVEESGSKKTFSELFPNFPERQDEWHGSIKEMIYKFKKEYGQFPNKNQAWSYIWKNPPGKYGITTGKDIYKEVTLLMGGKCLSKSAFNKRWDRWSGKTK